MKFHVIILEPAKLFIETLDVKLRAKTYRTIELLSEFGPILREPHSKKVSGTKELFELRVKLGNNICRYFYFQHNKVIYVITSGYIKKQQKLLQTEIDKALRLMNLFKEEINEKN